MITRDKRIRYRPVEKQMWVLHRVRGFVLTGRKSQSTIDSLALVESHWTALDVLISERGPGPWMYALTAEQLREIDLG